MAASAAPEHVERIVIENCSIATVDADDTEYASGHVVVAGNRIESVGSRPGTRGPGERRTPDRRHRTPRHPRPDQHAPPLLPVDHQGPGHRPQPVRLAGRPLPHLGTHRRADGPRRRPGLARHDGPRRRHHRHGPPLRLPAGVRRPVRRHHRGRPRHGRTVHPRPRVHGPQRQGRRAAAGLRRGDPRRRAGRHRGDHRRAPRRLVRRDDPGRGRTLLPVLHLHRTAAPGRRTGPPQGSAHAHPRLGDRGGGEVLPRAVRDGADRLLRVHRLARRGRVDGALRPHERLRHRRLRPHRNRRGALPLVQRPARRGHRPRPRHARGRMSRSASASTAPPPTSPASSTPSCATPCSSTASAPTARRP